MTAWAQNISAFPLVAVRGRFDADVAAGAAVVGIRIQESACPVAIDRARRAVVDARSGNARDHFAGERRGARGAASSAVEDIVGQIRAKTAAAGLSVRPAVIAAGPAVRVGLQVAAHPLAGRD